MTDATASPLQADVPCARCGYDLRGLTPPGKCPECAFDIDESIRAARFAGMLPPAQKRWARHMIEAVVIALAPFIISTVANVTFTDAGGPRARIPHVVAVTILVWSLSSWSAWRLATLEPLERAIGSRRRLAVALRGSAVGFLMLGCVWLWLSGASFNSTLLHFGLVVFAATAAVTFYLRVRHVAIRIGAPALGGQALMIALLVPSIMVAVQYSDSEGLFSITPTTGWAGIVRYFISGMFSWGDWDDLLQLVSWPILLTICQIAVLVQLLVALIRVRRRAVAEG